MLYCRPLARACGRDAAVLQQTLALVEAAARTDESSEYYKEAGYQHALLCDYGRAMEAYQAGARVGGTSAAGAIHGQIYCQVMASCSTTCSLTSCSLCVLKVAVGLSCVMSVVSAVVCAHNSCCGGMNSNTLG
jgi:hypothetical protein